MKLSEFSRLGGFLKSSGLGAMAAALAFAMPVEVLADDAGRGSWRAGQGSAQAQRGGGGWRGNSATAQRQNVNRGNWQTRAPRQQAQPRQPRVQQRTPHVQQRPTQVRTPASRVQQRWQDARSGAVRQGGDMRTPRTGDFTRNRNAGQPGGFEGRRDRGADAATPNRGQYRGRDGRGDGDRTVRDGNRDRSDRNWRNRDDRNWRDGDRNWSNRGDRNWRDGRRHRYDSDHNRWSHRWRDDNRYDWRRYRSHNRHLYRIGRYYSPYHSHYYRRLSVGFFLDSLFYSNRYWINDPWDYRLPPAHGPYRWVRYYDDALLVDIYTGEVVDVIHDFFW